MIVYLARAIQAFVMYCVNGTSRSSLLIESIDSMIFYYILALYLRRRRIYVTEEAFGCVQYFADSVNEGSSITFCKKCACTALRSCLPRQGNERTASTSFSSQSILRCGIVIARIILLPTCNANMGKYC